MLAAYEDLARRFDVIVIEGAGSVSELNLRSVDLVNLGLVTRLRAPWMLVADIERGGVFASILGTVGLLTPEERALSAASPSTSSAATCRCSRTACASSKSERRRTASACFRTRRHRRRCRGQPCAADRGPSAPAPPGARIAIVRLPRLSNATDFRLLTWADWITSPPAGDYDFVILPGTQEHHRRPRSGCGRSGSRTGSSAQHRRGATVIGICGGFQMLGRGIRDPAGDGVGHRQRRGLGLLPVDDV